MKHQLAVIMGRWQPFHKGHETLLHAALLAAEKVLVVMGSAHRARDVRNPFTWNERKEMLLASVDPPTAARLVFLPVRDYFDDVRWAAAVRQGVGQFAADSQVVLVGYKKDASSYYLDHFPQWQHLTVSQEIALDATALRQVFFETANAVTRAQQLAPFVHPGVLQSLQVLADALWYPNLVREYRAVQDYKRRWQAEVYLTADAVVLANNHVLLIQRGGDIGRGLWALPGGFVNKGERFYSASLRELREETGLQVPDAALYQAHKGHEVFDHPLRSPRGRLITCAYHFDLGETVLPKVQADDDAADVQWVPRHELAQWEDVLFEDHAAILDRFIGLYR
jgi:bifunctional NMN adenylyltransferase/nudix hydrolase